MKREPNDHDVRNLLETITKFLLIFQRGRDISRLYGEIAAHLTINFDDECIRCAETIIRVNDDARARVVADIVGYTDPSIQDIENIIKELKIKIAVLKAGKDLY